MKEAFKAGQVSEHVHWVGAIDWTLRELHGYGTPRGSTYNAFLIRADRTTLVDTVKAPYRDELIARISSVIDPKEIDFIVSNHSEMDHTGCLPEMIELCEPERVIASKRGADALAEHFGIAVESVSDGDAVDVGGVTLTFVQTAMLHWPDSMIAYLDADKVLFSQDGFGMHLASFERYADELDDSVVEYEAAKYYANILLPYSKQVLKVLGRYRELNLDVEQVLPDHGPFWRGEGIDKIIGWYARWAEQKPARKAVIVYDTMWKSTDTMARAIGEGLASTGAKAAILPLHASHRSDLATEVLDAGALIVGSPTINNNVFPTLGDAMVYLKGLRPQNMIGAAFGSFGWGGESTRHLVSMLEEMKVEVVAEPLKVKYVPTGEDLAACYELGRRIAERLQTMTDGSD